MNEDDSIGTIGGAGSAVELTGHGVEQFRTFRVGGRRILPADLDFLAGLHADRKVMELHDGERNAETTDTFLRANVAHWRRYQFGLYLITNLNRTEMPIGRAGLRWDRSAPETPTVDVSAVLAQDWWGKGLAVDVLSSLVSIGLDLGLPLSAMTQNRHLYARRAVEKTGFVHVGDFRRRERDWVRYEWPTDRPAPRLLRRLPAN